MPAPAPRLTAAEVGARLGMHVNTVYRLAHAGALPAVHHGTRSYRWLESTVAAYEQREAGKTARPVDAAPKPVPTDLERIAQAFRLLARAQERAAELLEGPDGWPPVNEFDQYDPAVSRYPPARRRS